MNQAAALEALGALVDPTRRRLYEYVADRPDAVGRDEAAQAAGVARSLAAFHLDRLAEAGVLEVEFRHLSDRRGPGSGRPAKLYRRARREYAASAPPRHYLLAAEIFADGLVASGAEEHVLAAAEARGRELGTKAASSAKTVEALMAAAGYGPVMDDDGTLRARNCPFQVLAHRHRQLTCRMNVRLLASALSTAGFRADVELAPRPDYCCVAVRAAQNTN